MGIGPDPLAATRLWVESFVIGLNLCPFARKVYVAGRVRFVVSAATDEESLLADLNRELRTLVSSPRAEIETTLLIHPHALADFLDYNDFTARAEGLIRERKLGGLVQLATFHPHYQFAGTGPDDAENYTNRSPYPMLHLLREDSVTEVSGDAAFVAAIPGRNVETMRKLGLIEVLKRLRAIGNS